MNNIAATHWIKYDPKSSVGPEIGEWCLWSMVIKNERNYFSGHLIVIGKCTYLHWEGNKSFNLDNGIYYARVNRLN